MIEKPKQQNRCKDCKVWNEAEKAKLYHAETVLECPKQGVFINGMCFCKSGEWSCKKEAGK